MENPKCSYETHKSKPAKLWHFLAHEDSWQSFLVDAVFVILIGKFLVMPGLGLILHTDYPLVAVVSSSMDHHGKDFSQWWFENGKWYEDRGITIQQFEVFYKHNGFSKGDAFAVIGVKPGNVKIGDVLIYQVQGYPDPIIHRVIAINQDGTFQTKGDANYGQISFETSVSPAQIQGKAVLFGPWLGWVKVLATDLTKFFLQ